MPVYKVTRWETSSQTAYIEADSAESAEEAANWIDNWTENQNGSCDFESELADPADYDPKEVNKV
jgi:hypothetical protein